jgi:hypothetical protein
MHSLVEQVAESSLAEPIPIARGEVAAELINRDLKNESWRILDARSVALAVAMVTMRMRAREAASAEYEQRESGDDELARSAFDLGHGSSFVHGKVGMG